MNSKPLLIFSLLAAVFVVYGYSQAVAPGNSTANTGPRIVVEPRSFDFGEVEFGKVVKHVFEVKNVGEEVLEIKKVSTSCACTKAKVDKEKLAPGGTADLLVTYDSGAMGRSVVGKKVERFVYIKSNDAKGPQVEVRITANVR